MLTKIMMVSSAEGHDKLVVTEPRNPGEGITIAVNGGKAVTLTVDELYDFLYAIDTLKGS